MRLIKIGKASEILGVTPQTLQKWERTGELIPDRKSASGTRYYDQDKLLNLQDSDHPTVVHVAVKQKSSLMSSSMA